MLTTEAYLARKWRSLPALRSLLEHLPAADSDCLTSVDETVASRMADVLAIAAQLVTHQDVVRSAARECRLDIHRDIDRLAQELSSLAGYCSEAARRVSRVYDHIESSQGGESEP